LPPDSFGALYSTGTGIVSRPLRALKFIPSPTLDLHLKSGG